MLVKISVARAMLSPVVRAEMTIAEESRTQFSVFYNHLEKDPAQQVPDWNLVNEFGSTDDTGRPLPLSQVLARWRKARKTVAVMHMPSVPRPLVEAYAEDYDRLAPLARKAIIRLARTAVPLLRPVTSTELHPTMTTDFLLCAASVGL